MHEMINIASGWFKDNLDIVFFIYGASFFTMGIVIWFQPKKGSSFRLADLLWLLSIFGLLHGLNEWLDMWVIVKKINNNLDILRSFVLVISFFIFFEFGRRLISIKSDVILWHQKISRYLIWWLITVALILISTFVFTPSEPWDKVNSLARYFLCFPSGLLVGYGLFFYYLNQEKILRPLKVRKYFILGSLSFIIYGLLSGLIVAKGEFILSAWLNTDSFFKFTHFPVQFFRAFCAVTITYAMIGILKIFSWERFEKLESEVLERTKELKKTNDLLKAEIIERKRSEEETKINYDMQITLNKLIYVSLQNISLEEMLKQSIELITSIPWLVLQSKGSIFLVEDDPKILVMKVQKGLSASIQEMCSRVPFGRCYCGRAALSGEIIFSDNVDQRHENRYVGMLAHGHYCVPIISTDKKILGVINLYIQQGKIRSEKEKDFLIAIANLLAGIIESKRTDDSLKAAYIKIQETQNQLIQSEKLKAIGQLASGVAHEIRNPLGIIMQGVNYLKKKVSVNEKNDLEVIEAIKESIVKADKIVSGILDFSRMTSLNLQAEDINLILQESLNLITNQFKLKDIEIIKEISPELPMILVDKNKIEQVFINLLMNSMQAMPNGGNIIVRSYSGQLEKKQIQASINKDDNFKINDMVVILEIIDTGIGISDENMKKIFDPFFTTKEPGNGTGLGLSISLNILKMHKSLIYIETQIGKGTKVGIIFKMTGGN